MSLRKRPHRRRCAGSRRCGRVLLLILLMVAATTWQDRYLSTRWRQPLFVAIYPIAADDSPVTQAYVDSLDENRFKAIDRFFADEATRYRLTTSEPFRTRLQPELRRLPPQRAATRGWHATALWSLEAALLGLERHPQCTRTRGRRACSCCITIRLSRPRCRIRSV